MQLIGKTAIQHFRFGLIRQRNHYIYTKHQSNIMPSTIPHKRYLFLLKTLILVRKSLARNLFAADSAINH